jgi:hypothetical protein
MSIGSLDAYVRLTKHFVPDLLEVKSSIIAVGVITSNKGLHSLYCHSKDRCWVIILGVEGVG